MEKTSKIYVAGHRGLVGSAILRALQCQGYSNVITRTHSELDLRNQNEVNLFFESEKPEYVFLAAAKVGGIWANSQAPADFCYDTLPRKFMYIPQNGSSTNKGGISANRRAGTHK